MLHKEDWKDTFDKKVLPPKGMRDFLPNEKKLREDMMTIIRKEYRKNGFSEIETSFIESIKRLENSDGGENTELLFRILRRDDNLDLSDAHDVDAHDLTDLGLRYDLTLPLCRFYGRYRSMLPRIFKAIQIGNVFRAEKPRAGRYNSFIQCDVDIIGDASNMAEIELLNTVSRVFLKLGLKGFSIKLNDRRIIKGLVEYAGFTPESATDVIMSLDKLDKRGVEGVKSELADKGYAAHAIEKLMETLDALQQGGLAKVRELSLSEEGYDNIDELLAVFESLTDDYEVIYDPTVVRGMGYYTGTVYEITYQGVGNSLAGGGRYDSLIGHVSDGGAPACGFSIGFERVADLLMSQDTSFKKERRLAVLLECMENRKALLEDTNLLKENYDVVSIYAQGDDLAAQLAELKEQGFNYYTSYCDHIKIRPIE